MKGVRGGKGEEEGEVDTSSNLENLNSLVDVVVDTIGSPALTSAAISKLGTRGRLVFISAPREGESLLGVEMVGFYRSEKSLLGVNSLLYGAEEVGAELRDMSKLFESGFLRAGQGWGEVKLEDGVEGFEKAGRRGGGKVVLVME